ncbi:MAG TPA: hypothetical protein VK061_02170 [Bacillota bacterium]|nr:hypothetical protein [Bacillota bacterium]
MRKIGLLILLVTVVAIIFIFGSVKVHCCIDKKIELPNIGGPIF